MRLSKQSFILFTQDAYVITPNHQICKQCTSHKLTYPFPISSFMKGCFNISWRHNSSQPTRPGLGPCFATSKVTRVRQISLLLSSSRTPSSMHAWVSSRQNSGIRILSDSKPEGVVERLLIEPSDRRVGVRKGGLAESGLVETELFEICCDVPGLASTCGGTASAYKSRQ